MEKYEIPRSQPLKTKLQISPYYHKQPAVQQQQHNRKQNGSGSYIFPSLSIATSSYSQTVASIINRSTHHHPENIPTRQHHHPPAYHHPAAHHLQRKQRGGTKFTQASRTPKKRSGGFWRTTTAGKPDRRIGFNCCVSPDIVD